MVSVDEALKSIEQETPQGKIINRIVDSEAVGYVVAEDVLCQEDLPAFRASIVDGYAITSDSPPGRYMVSGVTHAEPEKSTEGISLNKGDVVRVTTGAPIPQNADAVIMVEDTLCIEMTSDQKEEKVIQTLSKIDKNENVRDIGSDIAKGSIVMHKGEIISGIGGEIGLLTSVGVKFVKAFEKPLIGVLSTGNELVDLLRPGQLEYGEVRDSNRPALLATITHWGYKVKDFGIAPDRYVTIHISTANILGLIYSKKV